MIRHVPLLLALGWSSSAIAAPAVAAPAAAGAPAAPDSDPIAPLSRARANVIRAALARVSPAVVTIETIGGAQPVGAVRRPTTAPTTQPRPRFGEEASFRVADGPTTGLIWSADGLIITSSFNFVRDPTIITVVLHDGRRFVARLLARDYIRRTALLKVDAADLPIAEWASPREIAVGQYAIAVGRGFGGSTPAASLGIVSALGRRNGNSLQTDAKLSPANYGGPLIDIEGRVLGLIVPMAGAGGLLAGVEWYDSGIGFAVPQERIAAFVDRLAAGEDIESGKMGVSLGSTEPESAAEGDEAVRTFIRAVADPSPAKAAGLQPGDVIEKLDGQPVADIGELQRRISDLEAGREVTLSILRDDERLEIKLRLGKPTEIGELLPPGGVPSTQPTTQPAS